MSIGDSGRIVIEIDPNTKRELYAALQLNRQTLKEWFLTRAAEYLSKDDQFPVSGQESEEITLQNNSKRKIRG